jgi:hypothetical protein
MDYVPLLKICDGGHGITVLWLINNDKGGIIIGTIQSPLRRYLMRTKKSVAFFFGILLLMLTGLPVETIAAVNVNIGIFAPPPAFRIHTPPPVVVIPGTYIYAIPDIAVEILFYQGYWYRPHEGHWYRGKSYNGPWTYLDPPRVPRALFDLPPGYYRIPPGHEKIPYGHFKKNWGRWEREGYWERDERWREGRHGGYDDRHGGPPPGPPGRRDRRDHGPHGR